MKDAAVWAQEFKISEAKLEEWRAEAGENEDLLRWCLLNGKINEAQYLEWACRHFELPIVESQYFALEPDIELFEKVKSEGDWKPHMIPLHEWENVLLIACVQPVPMQLARPHRFLLAAASSLNFMWANLAQSLEADAVNNGSTAVTPIPLEEAPQAPVEAPDAPAGLNLDLKFDSLTPEAAPSNGMPDGFLMKDSLVKEGFNFGGDADSNASITEDMPDGLNLANLDLPPDFLSDVTHPGVPTSEPVAAPVQTSDISLEPLASVELPADPEPEMAPPPVMSAEGQSLLASLNLPKLEIPVSIEPQGMPEPPVMAKPIAPAPVAETAAAPLKGGFADVTDINISLDKGETPARPGLKDYHECRTFEEATDVAFANMQRNFEKAIMLVFQAGQLRPWRWTGNVQPTTKGKPASIDLTGASIFRIPFKTGLPYHGYVTPNSVNTSFFAVFNGGQTPKHVTIMPLMVSGRITGMIMGITNGAIDLRLSLRDMENVAENLSQSFATIRGNKAA